MHGKDCQRTLLTIGNTHRIGTLCWSLSMPDLRGIPHHAGARRSDYILARTIVLARAGSGDADAARG